MSTSENGSEGSETFQPLPFLSINACQRLFFLGFHRENVITEAINGRIALSLLHRTERESEMSSELRALNGGKH